MTIAENFLPEFDQEMATTRRMLERVPAEHADWKPHPKSYSLGVLALHITTLPFWGTMTLTEEGFDPGSFKGSDAAPRTFTSVEDMLKTFDDNVAACRAALASKSDADMMVKWALRNGDHEIFSMPRAVVLRSFVISHLIHHRGQLSVYLRLHDVPLPSVYGPTADDPGPMG